MTTPASFLPESPLQGDRATPLFWRLWGDLTGSRGQLAFIAECGAGPMPLALVETPRTMPRKDAHRRASPQFCCCFRWISYKAGSAPGTPELSASTARRTEEQLRGLFVACHPCTRASAAHWEEPPWVTQASCLHFLSAPGSRAAVQLPQIPLCSVFSRLINPIIVTVVTRWHTVQLYHAFCIIDVQLAS